MPVLLGWGRSVGVVCCYRCMMQGSSAQVVTCLFADPGPHTYVEIDQEISSRLIKKYFFMVILLILAVGSYKRKYVHGILV